MKRKKEEVTLVILTVPRWPEMEPVVVDGKSRLMSTGRFKFGAMQAQYEKTPTGYYAKPTENRIPHGLKRIKGKLPALGGALGLAVASASFAEARDAALNALAGNAKKLREDLERTEAIHRQLLNLKEPA